MVSIWAWSIAAIPNRNPAGLQDPNTPTWLKISWSTELMAWFRLLIHVPGVPLGLVTAQPQYIKRFGAFWWKGPVGCNRNVPKYRTDVLNVNQLNDITCLFSSAKNLSRSCICDSYVPGSKPTKEINLCPRKLQHDFMESPCRSRKDQRSEKTYAGNSQEGQNI